MRADPDTFGLPEMRAALVFDVDRCREMANRTAARGDALTSVEWSGRAAGLEQAIEMLDATGALRAPDESARAAA